MRDREGGFQPDDLASAIDYRGAKFADQFEALKNRLVDVRARKDRGDAGALDVLDAELTLQEFVGEHDNAGAYKSERFGEDLSQALDAREDGLNIDQAGHLTPKPIDQQSHYLMISVTELDRANEESGHTSGNRALSGTVRSIEQTVRWQLEKTGLTDGDLNAAYDIYRLRGSDFMVRLNTSVVGEASDQMAATIERALRESPVAVSEQAEAVPLTAVSLRLDHAMEIFNRLQDHLPEGLKAEGKDVKRLLVETIKRGTEFSSEVLRLRTNLWRAMIKKGRGDADAETFFSSYVAKSFKDTPLEHFEQINPDLSTDAYEEQITAAAMGKVIDAFSRERQSVQETEKVLLDAVAERPLLNVERLPETERQKLATYKTIPVAELTTRQARTNGNNELAAFRRQLESAKADPTSIEKTQKVIEHYGKLPPEARVDYALESERAKALMIVEKRLRVKEQSIDKLTGLPNRGAYYAEMKQRQAEAETSDNDVRVFFIDMAFLKYFNQEGGRDVGNYAIQSAAEVLEAAVTASGINNAKVFRYAGDEFTIVFDGDDTDERALTKAIEQARHDRGSIERSDASADLYRPEALQFNYGASDRATTGKTLNQLIAKGIVDGERMKSDTAYRLEQWTDISTRLADAGVGVNKAHSRLAFLIRRLTEKAGSGALEQAQTEALIRYSQKAIFGMDANAIKTLGEDVRAGRTSLRAFVIEKTDASRATAAAQSNALDAVIKQFARERFLNTDR